MITLDSSNLQKIANEHGLNEQELMSLNSQIGGWIENFKKREQGFYQVIDHMDELVRIKEFANKVHGRYRDIVVFGIGGSSLGTICLQQSLKHLFENEKHINETPKLHVLDNIDPALMREILDVISLPETLFIVVTKSGSTPETLAQYCYFRSLTDKLHLSPQEHFVFITDPVKGLLRDIAIKEQITCFDVPPNVGGRFSVLTAVGLLPAALIGIDIEKLIQGARNMRDQFLNIDPGKNLPFQLAVIQYLLAKKGKTIHVLMPYAQKLIRLADWYRQLLAESIGKTLNDKGEIVNVGITPVNALGATDQHSQTQLYNEGPFDKLVIFIKVEDMGEDVAIPENVESEATEFLKGVSFTKLLHTELEGTARAFTENNRPNITLEIHYINEDYIGQLFLLFEGATAFLGEMYGINAFNQPGVERSKIITKELILAHRTA
jgi:glucose-6-phosphate isomerase